MTPSWPQRVADALGTFVPPPEPLAGSPAAVLVPIFIEGDALRVWLLQRASHLRHHPGQIALPGGKPEPADADLLAAAQREAHEEIGLPPSSVAIVGAMPPLLTSTRFAVTPFVGFVDRSFRPEPQRSEVSKVFAAPLSAFVGEGELRVPPSAPERGPVPSYLACGEVVWGATAKILQRLAMAVLAAPTSASADGPR